MRDNFVMNELLLIVLWTRVVLGFVCGCLCLSARRSPSFCKFYFFTRFKRRSLAVILFLSVIEV